MNAKAITMANALIVTRSLDTLTPIVKVADFIRVTNATIIQRYHTDVLISSE